MRVEITLFDNESVPVLEVHGCHEKKFVQLTVIGGDDTCVVSIDDLRAALRKISA